jgi:hypothetical protein
MGRKSRGKAARIRDTAKVRQQAWYLERQQAARQRAEERAEERAREAAPRSEWASLVIGLTVPQSAAWTALCSATYAEDWAAATAALRRVQATGADDLERMRAYTEGLEWPLHVARYQRELVEPLREAYGSTLADGPAAHTGQHDRGSRGTVARA